eukprot:TRINITY_DN24710_c0_g2_i1.p1 TRINITY_DN24710_c0_g2~~TRINITY_DN24710_c0_g2_i1.p1  ORF type:complete len:749 (+),score=136.98 TRINITY_DN24710_c0_g2_i1:195-2249(+)
MGAMASIPGSSDVTGLTLLDIAKHGISTMAHMLNDQDRFALVIFNHEAMMVTELTCMDDAARTDNSEKLAELVPRGGTNLWSGMQLALDALREASCARRSQGGTEQKRLAHIMVLTDGASLERDKIMDYLADYKANHEQLPATIHTFGFGYSIDSRLLTCIARYGQGSYSFIPDAGFLGTCFCHSLANIFVTFAENAYLSLEPMEDDVLIADPYGGYEVEKQSWGSRICLGNLQYGQSKDIVVRVTTTSSKENYISGSLEYMSILSETVHKTEIVDGPTAFDAVAVSRHTARLRAVDFLNEIKDTVKPSNTNSYMRGSLASSSSRLSANRSAQPPSMIAKFFRCFAKKGPTTPTSPASSGTASPSSTTAQVRDWRRGSLEQVDEAAAEDTLKAANDMLRALIDELGTASAKDTDEVVGLLEDLKTQVTEAILKDQWYWKWGIHYLQSLMFAHELQQCNNFKDPGVQLYGGDLFRELRDAADATFNTLPPPQPSGPVRGDYIMPMNMAAYNNAAAGCIAGFSQALLADGSRKAVRDLRAGDRVLSSSAGESAEILCVVRVRCPDGRAALCDVDGALLTPYHPILVDGEWSFPADHVAPETVDCDAVYNFVLGGSATKALMVGATLCIALGHGVDTGAARHPYFGSERSVKDLESFPGFRQGFVELVPENFVRDECTGLVSSLQVR